VVSLLRVIPLALWFYTKIRHRIGIDSAVRVIRFCDFFLSHWLQWVNTNR